MSFMHLPDEVLKLVMHHVPLKERLTSCCLVNRRMHAAAVAVVDLQLVNGFELVLAGPRAQGFLDWLDKHGQHLTSLRMPFCSRPLQQLCCPNLHELSISNCSVQLKPADALPGILADCTKLTRLELLECNIMDAPAGAVLDCLSNLVDCVELIILPQSPVGGLSVATLRSMEHLMSLYVDNLSVENLLQLEALTNLQDLSLCVDGDTAVGLSSVPGLVFPASLTSLWLQSPVEASILSLVPARLQALRLECEVEGPAEGPGSLLSCMSHLQHLTELYLHPENDFVWPPAGPAYTSFTASTSLARLELHGTTFPAGLWPHVFPAGRKLLGLKSLLLGPWDPYLVDLPSAWGAADLSSLVSCCPNLHEVGVICLQHGLHVSELHKLTALTHLDMQFVVGNPDSCVESIKGVAALTQLKGLDAVFCPDWIQLPKASLLPLTSLTALTRLHCTLDEVQAHPNGFDGPISLRIEVTQDATPPDVWLKLLKACCADAVGQKEAVHSIAQQLADQAASLALAADRQQQLAAQQQELAAQQKELATQQGELSAERQVVSQQQGRAAELQGQLAAQSQSVQLLQGQVQRLLQASALL